MKKLLNKNGIIFGSTGILGSKISIELAKLDTFDALSAKYDYPVTKRRIHSYMKKYYNCEYELKYGSNG